MEKWTFHVRQHLLKKLRTLNTIDTHRCKFFS